MKGEDLVVGVEIGSSKICAVAGINETDDIMHICGFVEHELTPKDEVLKNGRIENANRTAEILNEVLDKLANDLDINLNSININISNPEIEGKLYNGKITTTSGNKEIVQEDVNKLFNDVKILNKCPSSKSFLHVLPMDFTVNDVKANEVVVGKIGVQIGGDFYFLSCETESIENLYYAIKSVNAKTDSKQTAPLEINNVVLSGIADAYVLLDARLDDKRNGVAIVNLGADLTELTIFHKNSIRYYKAFPVGGNAINNDLCKAFNIRFEEAENLKKMAGNIAMSSISDYDVAIIDRQGDMPSVEVLIKNAAEVVNWRLKEIAAIIKIELNKAGFESGLTNGIILTGGLGSMTASREMFKEVCKTQNVRKGKFNSNINFDRFEFLNKNKYSTVLGLLMPNFVDFDSRIDNRILKHSFKNQPAETPVSSKKKPANSGEKKSILDRFKNMLKDDDMNDNYKN